MNPVRLIPLLIFVAACQPAGPFDSDNIEVESRGIEIPATLVIPNEGDSVPLVVMAHGHGGTRDEAGGFTRVAKALAEAGIASIRMDFPGCGDSDEPFAENNLANMLADIQASRRVATDYPRIDASRVGILGFSMGGRLAILASAQDDYDAMALWNAVALNGPGSMVKFLGGEASYADLRATARREGTVEFVTPWGQKQTLSRDWFEQLEASMPLTDVANFEGDLMILFGDKDDIVETRVSNAVRFSAVSARSVNMVNISGADHGLGFYTEDEHFAQTTVNRTVRFFQSNFADVRVQTE